MKVAAPPWAVATIDSPMGPLLAIADGAGLRLLDFLDDAADAPRRSAEALRRLGVRSSATPEGHATIDLLRGQLAEYFAGGRREFGVPLAPTGTPFQLAVWRALGTIPFGQTRSYGWVATELGRPTATRAVGLANGRNPISILTPCHRVIGADGSLTGYGGGLERKRRLLELEASVAGRGLFAG